MKENCGTKNWANESIAKYYKSNCVACTEGFKSVVFFCPINGSFWFSIFT